MSDLGFRTSGRVRHRRFGGCLAVLVALTVLGGGGALVALKGQEVLAEVFVTPDYDGPGEGEVTIRVREGDTATAIGETLQRNGVVLSADAFTNAAKADPRSRSIQPGYYKLRKRMGGEEALALILDPASRIIEQVTIPEGLRLAQVTRRINEEVGIPVAQLKEALADPESLDLPDYAGKSAEGYLFPATYDVEPNTTAREMLRQMVERFVEAEQALDLRKVAADRGLDPHDVVTIASLVEKEARRPKDFGKVARVIYNRLEAGQRLQFDSTVHYALGKTGRVSTSAKDRSNPSPYNTYVHEGLPPGPIASPGERALRAALEPTPGDWIYFVTTDPDTGETKFAETWAQHEKYAQEFRQWCQDNSDRC